MLEAVLVHIRCHALSVCQRNDTHSAVVRYFIDCCIVAEMQNPASKHYPKDLCAVFDDLSSDIISLRQWHGVEAFGRLVRNYRCRAILNLHAHVTHLGPQDLVEKLSELTGRPMPSDTKGKKNGTKKDTV